MANDSASANVLLTQKSAKEAKVQARIEPALKVEAESIFKELGISATEAIRIFYAQVKLHRGLPFDVRIPNKTTLSAIAELDHPEDLDSYKDVDALFNNL